MGSSIFQHWHPLGISLDLVRGATADVAQAVLTEITRFVKPWPVSLRPQTLANLDTMFSGVTPFTNVPTQIYCLSTQSAWTVLWNNSFLCNGYDSLCHCLSLNHGLETIHWQSTDQGGVFQPGTTFTHRRSTKEGMLVERTISALQEDTRWHFHQIGPPLPEEDLALYTCRQKKDRFNETHSLALLARLGAYPREEGFYDFTRPVFVISRDAFPATISQRSFTEIQARVL